MKKTNGITLIALVITIIVLLILAGVSISAISGENGIASRAKEAAEKTETAKKEEEDALNEMEDLLNSVSPELNEYGFYFEQLYVANITSNGENIRAACLFHEDGSSEMFVDAPDLVPGYFMIVDASAVGEMDYEDMGEITFSEDGETMTMSGTSFKAAYEKMHGIYFGEEYEFSEKVTDETTGVVTETRITIVFEENGTATGLIETIVDGEVTNTDEESVTNITYENNGYAIIIDENLVGQMSADGNAILMGDALYIKK